MPRRPSRWTVFALLVALLFQLGAAAAAGLPSQSCCGTCDGAAAPAAAHCDDAAGAGDAQPAVPVHRHGNRACPACGDHAMALAPFVLLATATLPAVSAPTFVAPRTQSALPAPIPHRLERPPRIA